MYHERESLSTREYEYIHMYVQVGRTEEGVQGYSEYKVLRTGYICTPYTRTCTS